MTEKHGESKPGWRELPIGGLILEPGNAQSYKTGDWRTLRPVYDAEKCRQCMLCWIYCPDSAIIVEEGKVVGIDLDHCKGCGICARECPPKAAAITMVAEAELRGEEG
jgi:pyruvate ferredoxin oxidoreductase delta subunit